MTPHFMTAEVECRCGCGMLPQLSFMEKVERVRLRCGFPLPVSSAARCPAYDAKVGGKGPHRTGRAIDFRVFGALAHKLIAIMLSEGFTGIGVSQKGPHGERFVHGDDLPDAPGQPRPYVWSY